MNIPGPYNFAKGHHTGAKVLDVRQVWEEVVVLCDISSSNTRTPFVTWRYSDGTGFFWGHYFRDIASAKVDFDARVALIREMADGH